MEPALKANNILLNAAIGLLSLVALSLFIFISTHLNRGFELSDESYYCLASQYPYDYQLLNSQFGLVSHRFTFGHTSLLALRVFKLAYQTLAVIVFCSCLAQYARKKMQCQPKALLLACLCLLVLSFINYDYLPMTLSYNTWSLIFSLIFWSALLFAAANESRSARGLADAMAGFVLFALAYVKTPNTILLAAVYLVYLLIYRRRQVFIGILWQLGGALLALFFLFGSIGRFWEHTTALYVNLTTIRHASLGGYTADLHMLLTGNPGASFLFFQLALFAVMYLIRKKKHPYGWGLAVIFVNSLYALRYVKGNSADVANDFLLGLLFAINTLLLVTLLYRKEAFKRQGQLVFIACGLAVSPVLMALGTSNPLVYSSSHYLVLLGAGLFLLLFRLNDARSAYFTAYYGALSALCTVAVIYQGFLLSPYRQASLSEKNTALSFAPGLENILESPENHATYRQLSQTLQRCNPGRLPVMSSPPCLGGVLMAGMKPFAVFWMGDNEKDAEVNNAYFSKFEFKNKPFLILSSGIRRSKMQRAIFKSHGLDLEAGYLLCDSLFSGLNREYVFFMKPLASN